MNSVNKKLREKSVKKVKGDLKEEVSCSSFKFYDLKN